MPLPPLDVPLEVGRGDSVEFQPGFERLDQVGEVDAGRGQGVRLDRPAADGPEVVVPEGGEREGLLHRLCTRRGRG